VLLLDAEQDAPAHALTLTTRNVETPPAVFRKATAAVFKRLRRRFPWCRVEYYGRIEFTTGAHHRLGHRLMHGHYLLKGLDGEDVLLIEGLIRQTWQESLANAEPRFRAWVVEVAELRTPGAAIHYLGLHHAKRSQLPPAEWRGMAGRASKGYFREGVKSVREEAQRQLESEGLSFRTGLDLGDARFMVNLRRDDQALLTMATQGLREVEQGLRAEARKRLLSPAGATHTRPRIKGRVVAEAQLSLDLGSASAYRPHGRRLRPRADVVRYLWAGAPPGERWGIRRE
jgi:hypothetical protein